jgi:cytochrome c
MPSVRAFYEVLPSVLRHGGNVAMERSMKASRVGTLLAAALVATGVHGVAYPQDTHTGKEVFALCAACHTLNEANGAGPSLKGVLGRKAGTVPGFRYSRAMKGSGIVWDEDSLSAYLADPQKIVPGNLMPFSGLADAKQREELIRYLGSVN